MVSRPGRRFDADYGVSTEALVFLGDLDPEAIGPNIAHATHYEPTPVGDLERLLAHVPFEIEDATFVDIGSGMGRAVIAAALRPFRQVVGIEISPALHAIARDNLRGLERPRLRCRDVRLFRRDAASFAFPAGDFVAYLYNPFDETVLRHVVASLALATPGSRRALLYHTPAARSAIEEDGRFAVIAEEPFGVAYVLTDRVQDHLVRDEQRNAS